MTEDLVYAGFWVRFCAVFVDWVIILAMTLPLLFAVYGTGYLIESEPLVKGPTDLFLSLVFPAVFIIAFWVFKQATPGKMMMSTYIVDSRSGGRPSTSQFVGRYAAYLVSLIPLGLGFLWAVFGERKQAWHDKLAGTVVVRKKAPGPVRVSFEESS